MNGLGRKNSKKQTKSAMIFTKETLGVVLVLFSTLCLICLITGGMVFSKPGEHVRAFLHGAFGYFAYLVVIGVIALGVKLISDKKSKLSSKTWVTLTLAFFLTSVITHIVTMSGKDLSFEEYISLSYTMGQGGLSTSSGGGFFVALIASPITALLTEVGSFVVLGVLLAIDLYVLIVGYVNAPVKNVKKKEKFKSSYVEEKIEDLQIEGEREYPIAEAQAEFTPPKQRLFVNNPEDFAVKSNREMKKSEDQAVVISSSEGGLNVGTTTENYSKTYSNEMKSKLDYIKTPSVIDFQKTIDNKFGGGYQTYSTTTNQTSVSDYVTERIQQTNVSQDIPMFEHKEVEDSAQSRANSFADKYAQNEEYISPIKSQPLEQTFTPFTAEEPKKEVFERLTEENVVDIPHIEEEQKSSFEIEEESSQVQSEPPQSNVVNRRTRGIFFGEQEQPSQTAEAVNKEETPAQTDLGYTSRVSADGNLSRRTRMFDFGSTASANANVNTSTNSPASEAPVEKPKKVVPINRTYNRPPLDLLQSYNQASDAKGENHEEKMQIIQRTLEEFHINAVPQSYVQGPSITRYEIMMPAGVSVKKVLNFDDDLKMRLASRNGVRIEAPIPGKNLVGIEVANKNKITVGLKNVLEGMAGQKIKPSSLVFAIGKDIVGESKSDDLAKGPHYLVAGATGSGKSVCLNVMIVSLIMRYSPEDLRLILIDPKRVGFRCYEHLPHLMIDEIITEPKKALAVLQWAYNEMENRYKTFETSPGVISNIEAYNEQVASKTVAKMPRIVIIVDELADLMETCKRDMEAKIRALAQKARAAGIHLVLATQRPSVDIVTGTIKANLPSRIALKVMNFQDSQTILGEGGAEKLLGNGDMLYKNSGMPGYERYQGAWISDAEINSVVSYIIQNNTAYFDDELKDYLEKETSPAPEETSSVDVGGNADPNEIDAFFLKALWLGVTTGTMSIAQLQRRLQIGYARAGGLVDKMERMGFVSANEGSKARRVLLSREDFESRFGPMNDNY